MADREIINKAAIEAAQRALAAQKVRQAEASSTISQLQQRGSLESAQAIASLASAGQTRLEKLAKKATGSTQEELLSGIQSVAKTGSDIQTSYIAPYTSAMGVLGETPVRIPAPKYAQDDKKNDGQSAFDLLYEQFSRYGLQELVEPLKKFIVQGLSEAEFTLRLRETEAYKQRFAANAQRVAQGLRALSEGDYIALEDKYQDIMRRYGLPKSYYERGKLGRQEGFEKFIAGDVSPMELEDRVQMGQKFVQDTAPEISAAMKRFYPEITNGDILAYVLDPEKAITDIKRKVTAAEIGGAAAISGLSTDVARAEQLARYGITGEQARQGYAAVAELLPRGGQLAEIYKRTPYTQQTAEQEVFNLAGGTEAARERRKLTELERAAYSGQAGLAGSALSRERAGGI